MTRAGGIKDRGMGDVRVTEQSLTGTRVVYPSNNNAQSSLVRRKTPGILLMFKAKHGSYLGRFALATRTMPRMTSTPTVEPSPRFATRFRFMMAITNATISRAIPMRRIVVGFILFSLLPFHYEARR